MPTPLITVDELAAALRGPAPPLLLDVRWNLGGPPALGEYEQGHLPGAVFVDLDTHLAAPPGAGGRHPLPDPFAFQAAMRALGVTATREVVVYDAGGGLTAARAWWLLRFHRHPAVRLLDGGLAAWTAAAQPLSQEDPVVTAGDFMAHPGGMPLLDAQGAAEVASSGVLLDARARERYRGEVEPVDLVPGHIPGALSAPAADNLDRRGRLLLREALRVRFASAGIRPGVTVGAYCGSGVTAAHEVLALEVAGIPAALYAGSWSEWITDPRRPVATGAG